MNKQKKIAISGILVLIFAIILYLVYQRSTSTTRIALVNMPNFMATSIAKSTDDSFIRVTNHTEADHKKLRRADFVLIRAMGLDITAEQRDKLKELAESGIPFYSIAVTNPDNDITNIDSVHIKVLQQYIAHGNKTNYRSMLRYIRRQIDGKRIFAPAPDELLVLPRDVFFHLDEERAFETIEEYREYLRSTNRYKAGAPKVAIVGGRFGDPFAGNRQHLDSLIVALENSGLNVYPIFSISKILEKLQQVDPDAVIYLPHGRMLMGRGDVAVEWLKERNIPLFAPLIMLTTEQEWLNDPMGMTGGLLSQSVVMPELDGAIYPYTLIAQYIDREGFHLFKTIPERLRNFVTIINNFISLKQTPNYDKRIAIVYYKGPGQSSLVASGMEVIPSLFNFLHQLKKEGYNLEGLPNDLKTFEKMVMQQGATFGDYAQGAVNQFLETGNPELISATNLSKWINHSLPEPLVAQLESLYGPVPGSSMTLAHQGEKHIAVSRLQFGNVALLPQPAAGGGGHFQMVHGTEMAPPYPYVAAYLWVQHGFGADAIMHFGTHGSLEFTPGKQIGLSSFDWPDRLIGTVPHFYLYTISNVGEGVIAKRRSYATLITHITPPFMESELRGKFRNLNEKIKIFFNREGDAKEQASLDVKRLAVQLGIHRDLELDSILTTPYSESDIMRIESFVDELANASVIGQLYTLGVPYTPQRIRSSVIAMSTDPLAYSIAALDRSRGTVTPDQLENRSFFTSTYREPAQRFIEQVLDGRITPDDRIIASLAKISVGELAMARQKINQEAQPRRGHPGAGAQGEQKPTPPTPEQRQYLQAIHTIETTVNNILLYRDLLTSSPERELSSLINALKGGYIAPSPGGDAIANPNTLPTGRNLFSINAEATPSESAWDKGVYLARSTLETYMGRHGTLPRKVSYTFWGGDFITTEGATLAQAFYMLGVAPVWDAFGRVNDLRLIPSEELGRPRIDIVVQTSGQFRDVAASRLILLHRAIEMAANATGDQYQNHVSEGTVETERLLIEKGATPNDARSMSLKRIFGGINSMYGTGIMGLVESGDRWEEESQIAETYLHNMSAIYGTEQEWGQFRQGLLEAVLHNADLVVHPRQNNTWGPISLDHVYEFMGGMNLAIRHVTGRDPDAYFSDLRNRHNPRVQEVKEAIGVEARTTIFNPAFIREHMQGGASSAGKFAQTVNNVYGWNVMKPNAIDDEMWDQIYEIYVKDQLNLNIHEFFEANSPASLQQITAIMMETARKEYWQATAEQLTAISELHAQLIEEHGPGCTGFVCDNNKLRQFIAQNLNSDAARTYNQTLSNVRNENAQNDGTVMTPEQVTQNEAGQISPLGGVAVVLIAIAIIAGLAIWIRKRRKL